MLIVFVGFPAIESHILGTKKIMITLYGTPVVGIFDLKVILLTPSPSSM